MHHSRQETEPAGMNGSAGSASGSRNSNGPHQAACARRGSGRSWRRRVPVRLAAGGARGRASGCRGPPRWRPRGHRPRPSGGAPGRTHTHQGRRHGPGAYRSVTLHPAAAGEVVAVHFAPDQKVRKGSVLLELDSRSEKLAVDLARVRVRNARQLLSRYERSAGSGAYAESTVFDARSALEEAEIALRQAELALSDRRVVAPFDGFTGSDRDRCRRPHRHRRRHHHPRRPGQPARRFFRSRALSGTYRQGAIPFGSRPGPPATRQFPAKSSISAAASIP